MIKWTKLPPFVVALLCVGCASVDPDTGFPDVARSISERLGVSDQEHSEALLSKPLSADSALRIALQSNPRLRATYEELGVARAEVLSAALLQNPTLAASARPFAGGPSGTGIEADLAQNFLQLLMLPSRKRLAATQFEAAKSRVTHRVLLLAAKVDAAFHNAQGAAQNTSILAVAVEAAATSAALAERYYEAGNLSKLQLAREQVAHEQTRADWQTASEEAKRRREQLIRLLGLRDDARVVIPDEIDETLQTLPDAPTLEALALASRFDLEASRGEVEARRQAAALETRFRWIPFLDIGVSSEREADGHNDWVVGPSLALEIPIFDQGQAGILRAQSALRKSEAEQIALEIEIRSNVREAHAGAESARMRADLYRTRVLPLREEITALSLKRYNFMLQSPFELLEAKRQEVGAYRAYVDALRDFWVARGQLAAAVGGRLPVPEASTQAAPTSDPEQADSHPHHGGH